MSRVNRRITSREFKLMLQVDRFHNREAGIEEFWDLVTILATRLEAEFEKDGKIETKPVEVEDQDKEEPRRVYYLDTPTLDAPEVLEKLKSVSQIGAEKGDVPLPENASVEPANIVTLRKGLREGQVREGQF